MAKMYYTLEEAMDRLNVTEEQFRDLIREGKLREFRDAGKLNYRTDEVDRLVTGGAAQESGELSLEDSQELPLSPLDSAGKTAILQSSGSGSLPGLSGSSPGLAGSDAPIDLGGSDSGVMSLGGSSSGVRLEDSKVGGGSGSGEIRLDDSKSGSRADVLSLDEVDKDVVKGMKKDDTVITNIGISVFDDDDLEIAADPMAKTLMTGGDEHLGLDGSGGGSGLLDLTRESDDTSLGAELLEGIDMGDTAATMSQSVEAAPAAAGPAAEPEPLVETPGLEAPVAVVPMAVAGYVDAASPAFTGLLVAATLVMAVAGGMAIATALNTWPAYLNTLAQNFYAFLGGSIILGGVCAAIGYFAGKPRAPRAPRPPKEKVDKKAKKGKKEG